MTWFYDLNLDRTYIAYCPDKLTTESGCTYLYSV